MSEIPLAVPRPPVTIAGLDLSLTSTGVAGITGDRVIIDRLTTKATGCDRLSQILRTIRTLTQFADVVAIEGPSYGSQGGSQHERAGLWWLVRHGLHERGIPVVVIAPASLKKYATGKGNASKDQVLAAVIRRYPDIPVDGNDQADALVLAAMCAEHYDASPLPGVPQTHRAALASVKGWPDLPTRQLVP